MTIITRLRDRLKGTINHEADYNRVGQKLMNVVE